MDNEKLELPVGFGMALAMNEPAMKSFEALSESEKRNVLAQIHNINSKEEMRAFVDNLYGNNNIG